MYSNRQIFDNLVVEMDSIDEPIKTHHYPRISLLSIGVQTPLLILLVISLLIQTHSYYALDKYILGNKFIEKLKTDPNDESFFSVISPADKEWIVAEEQYLNQAFGMQRIPKEKLNELIEAEPGTRLITRIPFYDILSN
mmetsp:Transcript_19443/g.29891  ORF Transcript_19443/g.29891 Transcript_19443/m.29891 type:complete len:139 (+) Transcript_19443:2959-3375(+)